MHTLHVCEASKPKQRSVYFKSKKIGLSFARARRNDYNRRRGSKRVVCGQLRGVSGGREPGRTTT